MAWDTRLHFYNLIMVARVAEYQSFWFSRSSSIYSVTVCKGAGTRTAITRWRWPRSTLGNDMPSTGKTDKQATSIQTHKYKTDIKDGARNTQKGQPTLWQTAAFRWRCYGSRCLKVRDKCRRRRGEARTKTGGGVLQSLASRMQSWGRGGAKEIRPTASAGATPMWVFRAFTERKRYTGDSVSDGETWVTHPVTAAATRLRESGFLSLNRSQRLRSGWTTRFLGIVSGVGGLFHRDGGTRRRI